MVRKRRGRGTYQVGTLTPDFGPGKGTSLVGFLQQYDVIGRDEKRPPEEAAERSPGMRIDDQ